MERNPNMSWCYKCTKQSAQTLKERRFNQECPQEDSEFMIVYRLRSWLIFPTGKGMCFFVNRKKKAIGNF